MSVVNGVVVAVPPPEGYVVDFDNPQRQAVPLPYWIAGVGVFLTFILMGQRLYTKIALTKGMQLDDYFLIAAWITSLATNALCIELFANAGGATHSWEMPLTKFNYFLLIVYIAAAIYAVCGSFAKISLLVFYFRLSPERWFKWSIWATIFFIFGYSVGIFFSVVFACNPVAKSWDVTITEGSCVNAGGVYIATAVANIISDVILFCLPIPMVVKLQIPLPQKIGLFIIFTIGSLTVVTSIIRVTILPKLLASQDQPWDMSYATVWIIVEANLLIICGALPTLRKFFRHVAPKIIGESRYASGTRSKTGGGGGGGGTAGTSGGPSKPGSRLAFSAKGSRRDRGEYSQFDHDGSETFIMSTVDAGKTSSSSGGRGGGGGGGGIGTAVGGASGWEEDAGSEKGIIPRSGSRGGNIVQTKTVTVEYDHEI